MDILKLLDAAAHRFEGRRPSPRALRAFVAEAGGGLGEGIAVAALLWSMWSYFFPRQVTGRPKCQHRVTVAAKRCGAPIVHAEYREAEHLLVMVCELGHRVKKHVK